MKQLSTKVLREFYEVVVLPQFGFVDQKIKWQRHDYVDTDDSIHYFTINKIRYALIFEDYDGHGRSEEYLRTHVDLKGAHFKFVPPVSATDRSPSWCMGLPMPYKYVRDVTGTYTLIEISSEK